MKFTFICIVTVLLNSVCASADLEIYPDIKYSIERRDNYPSSSSDGPSQKRWPWPNIPIYEYDESERKEPDMDYDFTRQEQLLLQNLINQRKEELNRQTEEEDFLQQYTSPRQRLQQAYQQLLTNKASNYFLRNAGRNLDSQRVLSDVRMYPENDFVFRDDDEEEENDDMEERAMNGARELLSKLTQDNYNFQHKNMKDENDETSFSSYKKQDSIDLGKQDSQLSQAPSDKTTIKVDPNEFAYAPPDPRFYEKSSKVDPDENIEDGEFIEGNGKPMEDIEIKPRSDPKFLKDKVQHFRSEDLNSQYMSPKQQNSDEVLAVKPPTTEKLDTAGVYVIAVVAGISAAATVGLIAVGIGWYNLQKHVKNASDVEYPAYGVTGPNKDASPSGDRRLAQSAQMYHYQHQKQQILAMESRPPVGERHGSVSEVDSDEENEEGDYTVYECPGLAPTGEMEVKNPMFQDDPTPAQTPPVKPQEGKN